MRAHSRRAPPARQPDLSESVALVTSVTDGVRSSGTAFCVRRNQNDSIVLTCRHVVTDLDTGIGEVRVNGLRAVEIANGDECGVDMSILTVAGAQFVPIPIAFGQLASPKSGVYGLGFRHLHGDHYFSTLLQGQVDRLLTVRRQLSVRGSSSYRVAAQTGYEFHPGLSGSPICNDNGAAIGVLAFSSQDGSLGYVLSIESASQLLPALLEASMDVTGFDQVEPEMPPPTPLGKVQDETDLQAGRFGGTNDDGTVVLTAEHQRTVGKSYFIFDAIIRSVNPNVRLVGPAQFYLHDTYPRSIIKIRKPREDGSMRLEDIHSYGIYTLGCQVYCSDRRWHNVELNLLLMDKANELPEAILNR